MAAGSRGLICLHGFTGRGGAWRPVLAAGPAQRLAWCPDLLGHGPRVPGAAVTSFEAELDRLDAGLDRRGLERVLVVGYSLGARLGLGLLARYSERCAGAVLIAARAGLADPRARRVRRDQDAALAALLRAEGVETFIDRWQAMPMFASQQRLRPQQRAVHRRRRLSHTAGGLARSLEILGLGSMPNLRALLNGLDRPLRLMVGGLDRAFRAEAEALVRSMPRARLEVVSGVGHDVVLEAPLRVAAAIDEEWQRCRM